MAPTGFMDMLKSLYSEDEKPAPVLSIYTAVILSVVFTLLYVIPFYLSSSTSPSPTLSRDSPSVIKARVRAVTTSCFLSSLGIFCFFILKASCAPAEALRLLGWWPIGPLEIAKSFLLTALLFMGPLFEAGIVEGEWKDWIRGRRVAETLGGWIGWRNFVAGPITEEVIFRSIIIPLHLLTDLSPTQIVLIAPLYFGIAHMHHFYEFRLTHPHTSFTASIARTVFQFGYTTIFGWYATFLYLRTGSLPAVILVHAFCNYCGLPRLWGRVEARESSIPIITRGKEDAVRGTNSTSHRSLNIGWTVAYYIILVVGALAFHSQLWRLTESPHELVSFIPPA
ncbi:CaaX prenyl proteinase Rce1 [Histoplasma capsulatum H143]|uniref:intramembrane prenyl-peptidase Rce1 n=1 Tax=Ajellomyces capsulatus (strain H143) TaxID=544712 RepID=C6HHY8_AJECH|nr:CaaX prenyl proteinase Rce1 [Histoplasma capsulatum H143]